jgi:hypothetical protein
MSSAHRGASTLRWAKIEDSVEEFLTIITPRMESTLTVQAMTMDPPSTAAPRAKVCLPFERRHARCGGSATVKQARRRASRYHGATARTIAAQSHTQGREDLDGGLHLHSSSGQEGGSPCQPQGGQAEATAAKPLSASPPLTTDGVDKMYH